MGGIFSHECHSCIKKKGAGEMADLLNQSEALMARFRDGVCPDDKAVDDAYDFIVELDYVGLTQGSDRVDAWINKKMNEFPQQTFICPRCQRKGWSYAPPGRHVCKEN